MPKSYCSVLLLLLCLASHVGSAQDLTYDLATLPPASGALTRVYGSVGNGAAGLPVAGGFDLDGDLAPDYAFAAFQASVGAMTQAGQVFLVFGDGTLGGSLDTSVSDSRILPILGAAASEHTGSEIWMDDVTGDGLGDLLICRQDHTPAGGPIGAGALTIVVGDGALRTLAGSGNPLDLAAPAPGLTLFTITGADTQDRLCMWARTGDITGDGVADLAVGADQFGPDATHRGALYVLRGGAHLNQNVTVDLGDMGQVGFALAGHLAQILPPGSANHTHFGGTCQIADLDGNGRAEVLGASALNRAGGSLGPANPPEGPSHGSGGTTRGTVYIAWDDNFPAGLWTNPFIIDLDTPPGSSTRIGGTSLNRAFGEELLGGVDYDDDGSADLFVGDLTGSPPGRSTAGLGHVFYNAAMLRGLDFDLDSAPPAVTESRVYGPIVGAIGADTAMQGDFDGDGIADLAFSSPHDAPFGRVNAGTLHVLFGRSGGWPALIDLAPGNLPPPSALRLTEIYGARGNQPGDRGDTLAYSGAAGDIDGDGRTDILTNEMVGNGIAPGTVDVGNLIIIGGAAMSEPLFADSFESN